MAQSEVGVHRTAGLSDTGGEALWDEHIGVVASVSCWKLHRKPVQSVGEKCRQPKLGASDAAHSSGNVNKNDQDRRGRVCCA